MSSSEKIFWNNVFSHIYIEEEAFKYPLTEKILFRYNNAVRITIKHYKDIFCRPGQSFAMQKNTPKLILAVQNGSLLYKGSRMCDSFGHENFYYTTHVMNCVYNCEYCYLQGVYPSANMVIFVNIEDCLIATAGLAREKPLYICISYETDLLAMERITGFIHRWALFITEGAYDITLELRTKSASFSAIGDIEPVNAIILAWTLSPQEIIDKFEHGTPSLDSRLASINTALEKGWRVRFCFDPLLEVENNKLLYERFINYVFSRVDKSKLMESSVGAFRITKDCFKRMKKALPHSKLLAGALFTNGNDVTFRDGEEMVKTVKNFINNLA